MSRGAYERGAPDRRVMLGRALGPGLTHKVRAASRRSRPVLLKCDLTDFRPMLAHEDDPLPAGGGDDEEEDHRSRSRSRSQVAATPADAAPRGPRAAVPPAAAVTAPLSRRRRGLLSPAASASLGCVRL